MGRFLVCLQGQRVRRDVEDTLFWSVTKSGKFIVKSLYHSWNWTWVGLIQWGPFGFLGFNLN